MNSMIILAFLTCIISCCNGAKWTDAELVALRASYALLPPHDLTARIERDLELICRKDANLTTVHPQLRQETGKLLIFKDFDRVFNSLNSSKYGPVTVVENPDVKPFKIAEFSKPYSPNRLVEVLKEELSLGAQEVAPMEVRVTGDDTNIFMNGGVTKTNWYTFKKKDLARNPPLQTIKYGVMASGRVFRVSKHH